MRKKRTQKQIIIRHLKDTGEWLPSYELEKVNTEYGWIGSSGARRCRELAEDGELERKVKGRYVYYRINREAHPLPPRFEYDASRNVMVEITQ